MESKKCNSYTSFLLDFFWFWIMVLQRDASANNSVFKEQSFIGIHRNLQLLKPFHLSLRYVGLSCPQIGRSGREVATNWASLAQESVLSSGWGSDLTAWFPYQLSLKSGQFREIVLLINYLNQIRMRNFIYFQQYYTSDTRGSHLFHFLRSWF